MRPVPTMSATSSGPSFAVKPWNLALCSTITTVRVGRRTHGSLEQVMMACGAFSPGRALATSARFFAMTTGATGATVNALSRRGPRAWPTLEAANSTVAFNTAARSSGTTRRRSQLGCTFGRQRNARRDEVHATNNAKSTNTMYRLVSPKRPNLWQPGPN